MALDADVVIVGYGPGGQALASLLGQAGHRVVVFEKFPEPYGLPRMSTLDGEIARLLQHTGDGARALKESRAQRFAHFYGADDELMFTVDWGDDICGHPSHLSMHQPNIEAAMQERVASCPSVTVHWGMEATGIEDLGESARVTVRTVGDGPASEHRRVTAKYVIGMDGASSFVRDALGIELDVLREHDDQWFLTDFDILDPEMDEPPNAMHMNPRQPYFYGPSGARRCRTDVRLLDGEDPQATMGHEHGYAWLEDNLGVPREKVRITRRVLYRFRSQIARSFNQGRVFIGGDAAHAMTPHMAQGSCCAMRDSANLAWKLDLVLTGRARPELLDTYGPERRDHSAFFVQGSLGTWALLTEQDPVKAAQRDAAFRSGKASAPPVPPMASGILHRDEHGDVAPAAGMRAPQGHVRLDGREGLLDDVVGYGFQLISSRPLDTVLTPGQRASLDALGTKILVVGNGEGEVADLDGTYKAYFAEHGATALLARPDFYVFGVADGAAATSALVDDLLGQLFLSPSPVAA